MTTKLFLLLVIMAALALYWVLPKTRLGARLRMNLPLFYAMNIIGAVCGVAGVAVCLGWPEQVLANHYFEIILLPVFMVHLYTGVILRVRGEAGMYDEKQIYDMTRAAATAFGATIPAVLLMYMMYRGGILEGLVWFPIYVFFTITVYSVGTLAYYRRA